MSKVRYNGEIGGEEKELGLENAKGFCASCFRVRRKAMAVMANRYMRWYTAHITRVRIVRARTCRGSFIKQWGAKDGITDTRRVAQAVAAGMRYN